MCPPLLEFKQILCLVAIDFQLECGDPLLASLYLGKKSLTSALEFGGPVLQEVAFEKCEDIALPTQRERNLAVVI